MVFPKLDSLSPLHKRIILGVGIFFIAVVPSVYFYSQYRLVQDQLANPAKYAQIDTKAMVDKVSKLMTLPTDETPTLAIVNDVNKLKNQSFFAHSLNGDRVLIYTNAKKAILYRPSINRIIDVAPLNINQTASGSAETANAQSGQVAGATNTASVTFFLDNGTALIGLTKKYETELVTKLPNAKVVDRDNAKRRDYAKTLLIDVAGNKGDQAQQLSKTLGIQLAPMPAGEATPSTDFLIIIGADKK